MFQKQARSLAFWPWHGGQAFVVVILEISFLGVMNI